MFVFACQRLPKIRSISTSRLCMIHHVFRNIFTTPTHAIASTSMSTLFQVVVSARRLTTSTKQMHDGRFINDREIFVDGREKQTSGISTSWHSKDEDMGRHPSAPFELSSLSSTEPPKTSHALLVKQQFELAQTNAATFPDPPPTYIQHNDPPRRARTRNTRGRRPTVVALTNAYLLSDHDSQSTDPGRAPPYYIDDLPWNDSTTVYSRPLVTLPIPPLPNPTTPTSLYQNLLYLLSYRSISPSLPALLQYHTSISHSLRSARSYNLLIGLAIRHAAFRSAEQLLCTMRAEKLQGDLETWKLCIRLLIRTGEWGVAWKEVMRAIGREGAQSGDWNVLWCNTGRAWPDMPLPIWLEFFGTMKRGALRKRTRKRKWSSNGQGDVTREAAFEVLRETGDRVAADSTRYGMLMSNLPTLTQGELRRMPPRTMHLTVHMMLRTDQRDHALEATKSYLKGLPSKIDHNWARACLDVIHLHIIFPSAKRGLPAYHKTRKTVNTLLALHPRLRPNSTTLFLLLRSLRSTKRCGTIARNFASDFQRRWGPGMVDRRVKRRVASLALKEGRRDIVKAMMKSDRYSRWSRMMLGFKNEVVGGGCRVVHRKLLRACDRKVYGKKGKEGWRWKLLRWKVKRLETAARL